MVFIDTVRVACGRVPIVVQRVAAARGQTRLGRHVESRHLRLHLALGGGGEGRRRIVVVAVARERNGRVLEEAVEVGEHVRVGVRSGGRGRCHHGVGLGGAQTAQVERGRRVLRVLEEASGAGHIIGHAAGAAE